MHKQHSRSLPTHGGEGDSHRRRFPSVSAFRHHGHCRQHYIYKTARKRNRFRPQSRHAHRNGQIHTVCRRQRQTDKRGLRPLHRPGEIRESRHRDIQLRNFRKRPQRLRGRNVHRGCAIPAPQQVGGKPLGIPLRQASAHRPELQHHVIRRRRRVHHTALPPRRKDFQHVCRGLFRPQQEAVGSRPQRQEGRDKASRRCCSDNMPSARPMRRHAYRRQTRPAAPRGRAYDELYHQYHPLDSFGQAVDNEGGGPRETRSFPTTRPQLFQEIYALQQDEPQIHR